MTWLHLPNSVSSAEAGGGLLATQHLLGWQTVCYVEWDKYAVDILKARIRDGYLHDAPIWDNVFTFDGRPWRGLVDVVSAGFPCQPFSTAGKGLAELDPRNGWPATIRIIREVRPAIAWLENVPGLISKSYFRTILGELSEAGYCIQWDCVSAAEVGANHKRERLWIIAYAESSARDISSLEWQEVLHTSGDGNTRIMADSNSKRRKGSGAQPESGSVRDGTVPDRSSNVWDARNSGNRRFEEPAKSSQEERNFCNPQWWEVEPDVGRVADGVAFRMDRLRATGNGQVSAVVAEAWHRLTGE